MKAILTLETSILIDDEDTLCSLARHLSRCRGGTLASPTPLRYTICHVPEYEELATPKTPMKPHEECRADHHSGMYRCTEPKGHTGWHQTLSGTEFWPQKGQCGAASNGDHCQLMEGHPEDHRDGNTVWSELWEKASKEKEPRCSAQSDDAQCKLPAGHPGTHCDGDVVWDQAVKGKIRKQCQSTYAGIACHGLAGHEGAHWSGATNWTDYQAKTMPHGPHGGVE